LLGAVLLVTLLIIGAGVSYFVFLTEQEAWQGRQGEAARYAVETVEAFIQNLEDSLTMVSLLDRDYLTAEPQVIHNLLQQNPALLEMVRLDASGKVLASAYQDTPLLANLFTIPQSTWFLQATAGEPYLGNIQISPAGDPYLIIAVPAPDGGAVAARLCMNMLWDVVAAIRFGETGQAYVVNQEGRIIAHTKPEVVLAKTSLAGRAEMAALSQSPGHKWNGAYVNLEGTPVMGTMAPVPGTGWVVISELTQSEAFAVSRTAGLLLGGGVLLFGVLVMWVTTSLLERQIFEPMERLRAGAERIGGGDLSHRIDIARQDEVGQVAAAFNEMVVRLREREDQLTARTAALAAEVAERKRAEEEIKRRGEELEALREISLAITAQLELDELLQNVVERGCRLLNVGAGGVYLVDETRGDLTLTVSHGFAKDYTGTRLTPGEGIAGKVLQSGALLAVDDYRHWEGQAPDWETESLTAVLGVPLKRGGQVVGVLNFSETAQARSFDEHDVWLATLFANQAAIAIQNARLFQAEQEQRELAEALEAAAAAVSSTLHLDQVLDHILEQVERVVSGDAFSIELVEDNTTRTVRWRGYECVDMESFDTAIPIADYPNLVRMSQNGKPAIVLDTATDPDWVLWKGWEWVRSYVGAPIQVAGETVAFLNVDGTRPGQFGPADARRLQAFANQVAAAIENAQLYETVQRELTERKRAEEEAQRRAAQAALTYEVGQRVSSKLELDVLLSEIVTAVRDAFDCYSVELLLLDEKTERLTMQSAAGGYADTLIGELWIAVGEGMVGYAAATGETQVSGDVSQDPHHVRMAEEKTRSELAVAIKSGQKVIGVLDLQSDQYDAFDETDVMVMETLADRVAQAMENARLFEDTRSRLAQLTALQETTRAVASTLELDKLLNLITQQATTLLQGDGGIINLVDWEKKEDEVVAASGSQAHILGFHTPLEGSLSGWVTLHNQPVISNQLRNDSRAAPRWRSGEEQAQSAAIAPLTIKDQVMGTLVVMDKRGGKGEFDQADLDLLMAFANQAATAIENARLFEETQRRVRELRVLHDVGLAAASGVRLEETLQTAAEALVAEFEGSHVEVGLVDQESGTLCWKATVSHLAEEIRHVDFRLGEGITGWVAQHGEPALVPDVHLDPRYIEIASDTRSELCVPLVAGPHVIGVLNLESPRLNAFTDDDQRLLITLASNLTMLTERVRLFEEVEAARIKLQQRAKALERRAAQLALINDVGGKIAAELELSSVLDRAARLVQERFDYHHVALFTLDREQDALVMRTRAGDFAHLFPPDHRLKLGQGLVGWVGLHGERLLVNDVDAEPRYVNLYPDLVPTRSELSVPIRVGEEVVGVLDAQSPQLDGFDENDVMVIETLANQIAVAIENAQLYEAVQRELTERKRAEEKVRQRTSQLEALREVGLELTAQLDLDTLLLSIVSRAAELLGAASGGIYLYRPEQDVLEWIVSVGPHAAPAGITLHRGEGLSGKVLETGEPLIVDDYQHWEGRAAVWEDHLPVTTVVAVPVRWGEEFLGVLNVVTDTPRSRSLADTELLNLFATQIAIAIRNAQMYEQAQHEITERKRAEEALRESEEKYRLVTDNITDLVSMCDMNAAFVYVSPSYQTILGYDPESLIGLPVYTLVHPDDLPYIAAMIQEKVDKSENASAIFRMHHKDGHYLWFESHGRLLLDPEDRLRGAVFNTRDITERKQAEERLERYAAELEQSNEEVKQFAYIVSHDLRAPLVNLKGFAAELRAALAVIGSALITTLPYLDDKQRPAMTMALQEDVPEALGFIDSSVTRMDHFINAVLKLSRLGRHELKPEPIDMNTLVQATLQTLAHQTEGRQVEVTVGCLPEVVADRTSMEQVLGNLLTNAVIYLDPDRPGEIEVGAGERNQVIKKEPGFTTFWVRDNGRGIKEEDMDKVFAPFRRAGKQDVPGEGMGLPYVQTLIRRHGGRLWVESEPGKGSTFYFTIPVDVRREA